MSVKLFLALVAGVVCIGSYIPYGRAIFRGTTQPHLYTWLIWTLTTGTAAAGFLYGGGGWAAIGATLTAALTFLFFLLSFKYGTKNVTTSDGIVLALALLAISIWWQLQQPVAAIILVSLIDIGAYIPTYRKSWAEPWSESMTSWIIWIGYGVLNVLALEHYNWLTLPFILSTTITANLVLIAILLVRRRVVPKPAVSAKLQQ